MENLSIISFNSTKVQLEPSSFARSSLLKFCFNSTKVQLELTPKAVASAVIAFQFH